MVGEEPCTCDKSKKASATGAPAAAVCPVVAVPVLGPLRPPAYSRAAFVVYDPDTMLWYHSDMVLPAVFYESLSGDDATFILQAEIIAAITAYTSLPHILAGRPVIHFIDNTGALSLLIHGYSSRPDCARLVNSFHLLQAIMRSNVWFEWVPSAANIADLPSRGAYNEFYGILPTSTHVEFVLPQFQTFNGPLSNFLAAMEQQLHF